MTKEIAQKGTVNADAEATPEQTLDEKLAALVVEKLRNEHLVSEDKRDELLKKLATGTARQEDWKLWLDPALLKKEAGK